MSVWFEGEGAIDCTLDHVKRSVDDIAPHFVGVVGLMPGLSSVELVEQQSDSVTIRTNEGLMKRTDISTRVEADRVVVEYGEGYQAGSKVTTNSHFTDEFVAGDHGVTHHLVVRDLSAPGLLGFFYRRFGSSKMGNAFLAANKALLERAGAPEESR